MAVQRGVHPSADILKAFGLGKLDESSSGVVLDHLDQCEDCRKQVASLSGDDFLNRLRQARGRSFTPAPARPLGKSAAGPNPPVRQPATANLPPELANNPQYQILRELGRGGMGVVYLAKNKLMDRLEVLKVVNKVLLDHPGAVERFLREIRSAAKLSHANVVGAYHALQIGELLAFAMEYVEGQDLGSLVKSQGPLPVPHACFYVQQAALGLQHAFEKGMVHRDIKPQNLILAREGKKHIVKVLDFGLAKVMREKGEDTGLTGEGKMLGTPDYIAPEQTMDAAKADIRADIYSLGCTLYYLLSGHPPFSASSLGAIVLAHQMHEAKPLNLVRPEVPEELAAVVRKMMAKSPAKRYQAPLEVVQALGTFVKQGATAKASPELSVSAVEAKPAVKKAAPVAPPPAPAAAVPKQQPAAVWESLMDSSSASVGPRKSEVIRTPRAVTVTERRSQKRWLLGGGIGVGMLLLALLGMWTAGVFKVKTPDGTIVLENLPNDAEVLVDGAIVIVKWDDGGKTAQIRVPPGRHKIEATKDGITVIGEEVEIEDGKRHILTAKLVQQPTPPKTEKVGEQAVAPPLEKTSPLPDTNKPDTPRVAGAAGEDKGYVPLFNGKDLSGWSVDGGIVEQWSVEGDTIVGNSSDPSTRSYLLTDKEYANFVLRFDFKVEDGNHGVAIRAVKGEKMPLADNLIFDHPLITLMNPAIPAVDTKEPTGTTHWLTSADYSVKPSVVFSLPSDTWHSMEIVAQGDNCTATIANKQFLNVTLDRSTRNKKDFVPGLQRVKGKVGFQANIGTVRFRKIEIKQLSPAALPQEPPKQAAKDKDSFFNEKDLTDWEGLTKYWSVKDRALIGYTPEGSAHNTFLCSKKQYGDFELKFKVRLKDGIGNSGVQIRSKLVDGDKFIVAGPQCDIGASFWGSLYGERFGGMRMMKQSPPDLVKKAVKPNDFNDFYIKCVGKHVIIKVNGETMVDDNFPTMPDEGIVAWQLHAGFKSMEVTFKDIQFKELSARREAVDAAKLKEGWVQLFNGKDLSKWIVESGDKSAWRVEAGELVASNEASKRDDYFRQGYLLSIKDYSDFVLLFQFQLRGKNTKSGIALRAVPNEPTPQNYPYHLTVLLGHYADFDRSARTGSLWWAQNSNYQPVLPAKRPAPLTSDKEWNDMEVEMRGHLLRIAVNGIEVQNVRLDQPRPLRGASAGLSRTKGRIGFMQRADEIRFRNIRIRELSSPPLPVLKVFVPPLNVKDEGFVSLFNGKDLAGWKTHPDQPRGWSVEDGCLVGRSATKSHLFSTRGDYEDFHLKAEVSINKFGNSGILFRSEFGLPRWGMFPDAYEAQILNSYPKPNVQLTGSLCRFCPIRKPLVKPDEWFTLEILASGNRITIKVNGKVTVDFQDTDQTYRKGHLVLQAMSDEVVAGTTVVRFRNIEIKEPKLATPGEGQREGIESLLRVRFGDEGLKLMPEIREIHEEETLRAILKALETATSLDEVRRLWAPGTP